MNKTTLVFKHEFLQAITKVGYFVMTLIVPVIALLAIGVFELVTTLTEPSVKEVTTVGYVDEVGIFSDQTDQGLIEAASICIAGGCDPRSGQQGGFGIYRHSTGLHLLGDHSTLFAGQRARHPSDHSVHDRKLPHLEPLKR